MLVLGEVSSLRSFASADDHLNLNEVRLKDFRPGARFWGLCAALVSALLLGIAGDARTRPLFDRYQVIFPRPIEATDVVVVVIDDAAIEALGVWPWPRYVFARLIAGIARERPSVIGVSVIFSEPDRNSPAVFKSMYHELPPGTSREIDALPSMDALLANAIGKAPTVLAMAGVDHPEAIPTKSEEGDVFVPALPGSAPHFNSNLRPISLIRKPALGEGLINVAPDSDGVLRDVQLAANAGGIGRAFLPLEMIRQASGGKPIRPIMSGSRLTRFEVGPIGIPVTADGSAKLWFGQMPQTSFYSALNFLGRQPVGLAPGKFVIVGLTGSGTSDIATIPHGRQAYGVEVQAQALDSMLKGQLLARPGWAIAVEWSLAVILALSALLLFDRVSRRSAVALPMIVTVMVLAASISAFYFGRLLIDPVLPLGVGGGALAAIGLVRFMQVAQERETIHRAFDRYLSPELVARIAKDPSQLELGGEERDVTVLFCDIRGFSAMSEHLTPNQIIQFLIGLLTPMTDILLAGHATIDKYVGDAVIAFWNAPLNDPRHAQNAADSALEMSRRLVELNRDMPHQSRYPWPGEIKIGIGLNAGLACVGNLGSERRLNYSMIGDTVNLASRIEGLTKLYGVEIAIGDDLARRIRDYAIFEMDRVKVVGRDRPEAIWALVGDPEQAGATDFLEFKGMFEVLLDEYRAQQWAGASKLLQQLAETQYGGRFSALLSVYKDRISILEHQVLPADWDGVFAATEK